MTNIGKFVVASLLVLLVLNGIVMKGNSAEVYPPQIVGAYGVTIDAKTGEILYNKNAHSRAYPASMTKVLTATVLDERMKDGEWLTVSSHAANQECLCLGLRTGERITKQDAMKALLLLSANDVAVTIAENVAGSEKGFADLMNQKVQEWGLKNTHFVTPNGLHDPNHYTTPYDMALITREAIKHPNVLEVMSTQTTNIKTSIKEKTIRNLMNIQSQPNAIAGKPGFTNAAQHTLLEYLKQGNKEIISVVMKTDKRSKYHDIQTMATYSFDHMNTVKRVNKVEIDEK
ncbi:D-alanyl-D-alanine carboxypeptidase [Bacillus sp. SLBN-46]|uniref:D-alanyl-D-alanine carboxypeptidase family protein n=1 Tax=Bacillus sp. SLBN-46 TaxID=3042283 RepID=UPI0028638490|nr:D-alanyl-D-alanine carboxypeptidase family protein [Bacillus sp. SLBN-46]MDR6123581.1 D-alanyl-D-alanine carboxypeptidase [Bacillus sp. SLBN-46]